MSGPLSTDEARKIINDAIDPMRHVLWLGQWHMDLSYGRLDDGVMGQCRIHLTHQRAEIQFDPQSHKTKEDLLDTLRHELLHLVIAYFDHARTTVAQYLQGDPFDACDVGFTLGAEHSVRGMERVLDACGLTPAKLIKRGNKMLGKE